MSQGRPFATLRLHLATLHRENLSHALIARFGGAEDVFRQSRRELCRVEGMTPRALKSLTSAEVGRRADEELRRCEREGISLMLFGGEGYPRQLAALPDMPLVIFCRGGLTPEDALSVGIVGSRRPSPYGLRQARLFSRRLAGWGAAVVSGLARGIDGAAQEAALEAGGRTIAVLGSGLGRIYPPEHSRLAERIVGRGQGAVLSEFPFEAPPRSFHFPQRNRLLSGLSAVVLVVEAGERSGSLITVDWALRQGKSVFVLPGRVDQPQAAGALKLLRDGASPALAPEDLLGEMGLDVRDLEASPEERPPARETSGLPGPLGAGLGRLFREEDVWDADRMAERLDVEVSGLLGELARLEIEGYLRREAGGGYRLTQ